MPFIEQTQKGLPKMTTAHRSLLKFLSTCVLIGFGRLGIWLVVLALGAALVSITLSLKEEPMSPNIVSTFPQLEVTSQERQSPAGPTAEFPPSPPAPAETDFLGQGVLDIGARPQTLPIPDSDKIDVDIDVVPGGGAVNMAEAYQLAGGENSRLGVITGADSQGNLLTRLLASRLTNIRRIATAVRTRISLLTPRGDNGEGTRIWTERSPLDDAATFAHVKTWLTKGRRLVMASMTALQAGLVEQVLDAHTGQTVMMLTRSQCEDRERTLALAARCTLIQLNASELAIWTGKKNDVVAGINWLRERGITSVIVTAGVSGIFAYLDWAGGWLHVPAFRVAKTASTAKCGDFVLGTFLAGLDRGESARASLRIAAAAAAMNAAGLQRTGGWQEVAAFADETPTAPFVPVVMPRTLHVVKQLTATARRLAVPTGYMTAGAAIVVAMIWAGGLLQ